MPGPVRKEFLMTRHLCVIAALSLFTTTVCAQVMDPLCYGNLNAVPTYSTQPVYYTQQQQNQSGYVYQPTTSIWNTQPVLYNQQSQAWYQPVVPSTLTNYGPNYALSGLQEYQNFSSTPSTYTHPAYRLEELRLRQNQQRWLYQQQLNQVQRRDDRSWEMYQLEMQRWENERKAQARYQRNVAVATMFGAMIPMAVMATTPAY